MKKSLRILLITGIIVALLTGASATFLRSYPADDAAKEAASKANVTEGPDGELIFRPASDNGDATGLIFYPGGSVDQKAYAPLMQLLSDRGITCVLLKMPLDLAIFDIDAAAGISARYPEVKNWYIGGHSLGGAAASMFLTDRAEEYKGLLLLGSYANADLSETKLKVLSVYGKNDGVMNRENYEKGKASLPKDFTELVIPGGNHANFGSYGAQKGDGTAAITPEEQRRITADAILEWIQKIPGA